MVDQDLLSEIQSALLEPTIDGGQSWLSGAWTRGEVHGSFTDALRRIVRDLHLTVARAEIAVTTNTLVINLPADTLATVTGVWRDTATGTRTPLGPMDAFEADTLQPGWEGTAGATPIGLVDYDGSSLTTRLAPTPAANGTLELLYVPRPADVRGNGVALPIPDVFGSAVKYQTLGRLLSKVGRLQDPTRAAYCAERVQVAEIAADLLLKGWA